MQGAGCNMHFRLCDVHFRPCDSHFRGCDVQRARCDVHFRPWDAQRRLEASAARVARALMERGFARVRPLQGGLDAWIDAGHHAEDRDDIAIRRPR
jgi:hypothetical protein